MLAVCRRKVLKVGGRFDWVTAMALDFQAAKNDLVNELARRGLGMTPTAMAPLQSIDFTRLVGIYDHEERFLRDVFTSSLLSAQRARVPSGGGMITAHDVRTAMLMLGAAVSAAPPQTFSDANKPVIQAICPYC